MEQTLGLYLHIPFCKSKCAYCDFYSLPHSEEKMDAYAAALGIDTVLTSGGAESCRKGTAQLAALLRLRDTLNGPEILIGAGVSAAVIDELRAALPGARAFHASCKKLLASGMAFRRDGVPMGLPGLDEWHIQQTDADAVRAAKAALLQ